MIGQEQDPATMLHVNAGLVFLPQKGVNFLPYHVNSLYECIHVCTCKEVRS